MTVDISRVFKANVKAIRVSLNDSNETSSSAAAINEELFGGSRKKTKLNTSTNTVPETRKIASHVAQEARNIIQNITILKNFLLENKKAYIQPNYLLTDSTDDSVQYNWQAYEDQAENIIKRTADSVRSLKQNTLTNDSLFSPQYREHLENIFYLLEKYLKEVCNIYSEQKAIRVKRILDRKNFSQLCSADLKTTTNPTINKKNPLDQDIITNKIDSHLDVSEQLSAQEIQMYESENDLIYDDLVSQSQEIKQIETEVIEVSRLATIFAENIVSQGIPPKILFLFLNVRFGYPPFWCIIFWAHAQQFNLKLKKIYYFQLTTADSVHKSVIEANTNIIAGNEDIKEAMKKNAALRLWILFIIVVLSFTLLFLDWYND